MGKPLLMGAATYRSIGRPLPGRETIVLTRNKNFATPNIHVAHELDSGLSLGKSRALKMGANEIIICGGGEVFSVLLDRADILHISHVDLAPHGDVFFPSIDARRWTAGEPSPIVPESADEAICTFVSYRRI